MSAPQSPTSSTPTPAKTPSPMASAEDLLQRPTVAAVLADPLLRNIIDMDAGQAARSAESTDEANNEAKEWMAQMKQSAVLRALLCDGDTVQQLAQITLRPPQPDATGQSNAKNAKEDSDVGPEP